ncbi:MAG: reverse transcriptase/maturase family protein [Pirellulaceae bacterium]|nr:reverse transcriptase/maturase family protein [Pirellulaceae bacterium]
MKRARGLWPQILDRNNLRLATCKALNGKRSRSDARKFIKDVDRNLARIACELDAGVFQVGRYHQFVIHDPKERVITAPCFEERVLHHAMMNVCEPIFERWFVSDTYACRKGRGRIAALLRSKQFSAGHVAYLKMDIRKYFDSIPHASLLARLERLFKDQQLLELWERIVGVFRGNLGIGLPIGALTSQHLANFYLGHFDRFAKEKLRVPGYVRYMDDIVLWSNSLDQLHDWREESEEFLLSELGLQCKANPYVNRTKFGIDFLGCRVWPTHLTLNRRSRIRFQRNLKKLESLYASGHITSLELQQRTSAMLAFTKSEGVCSWRFRHSVLKDSLECGQ